MMPANGRSHLVGVPKLTKINDRKRSGSEEYIALRWRNAVGLVSSGDCPAPTR